MGSLKSRSDAGNAASGKAASARPPRAVKLLLSCEHASLSIPARYHGLGVKASALRSHIGWDAGARMTARTLSQLLDCPSYEGRYSRLLVDLNRSLHHPKLIPRWSFGTAVPGNDALGDVERERRIRLYYIPYRRSVQGEARRILDAGCVCIHISVHSFAPVLNGAVRLADVGILYDPRRERTLSRKIVRCLRRDGLRCRCNYPYRGISDGITTALRKEFADRHYLGIEVELNQNLLRTPGAVRRVAGSVAGAVQSAIGEYPAAALA